MLAWRRARNEIDALIDESVLPDEHRQLVRRVIHQVRLPASARIDVAEELICHFEDGLACGVAPDALVSSFGLVDPAAELIRRGVRRRRRAEPWRRRTRLVAAGLVASVMTAYVSSAVALHAADPLTPTTGASLGPDAMLLRASTVRATYDDLLDRVYSGDDANARVTAKGLRVLQALRGKTNPGVISIALEPAYFVAPARRWEVEREIDAIAADVERVDAAARLRMRQAALEADPIRALRYFPITVTVARLAEAAERAQPQSVIPSDSEESLLSR